MYVVEHGVFDILVNGNNVASLGRDTIFGELALMYDAPRAATVATSSSKSDEEAPGQIVLWRIGRDVFKYLIKSVVQQSTVSISETLGKVKLLEPLTDDQKLQMGKVLEPVKFEKDDVILHQGDEGHIFYIIKSGSVVCRDTKGQSEDLHLTDGDYFGELALLTSKPRQRDVIATSQTTCLALDRESFNSHLGSLEDLMSTNMRERVLNCMPLFMDLSSLEKHLLAGSFSTETFQHGDSIVKENEIGNKFFIVVEGTLQ
jgi:CRP-like cAMP-binding protein